MSYKSKYMHIFETLADFQKKYGNGWLYSEPWVSVLKQASGDTASFNLKPEEKPFNVGEIIMSKDGKTYSCPYTEYKAADWSGYAKDGICCIPSNFLPDGHARMIALHDIDNSGASCSTHSNSMIWGSSATTTGQNYYKNAIIYNNVNLVWTATTNTNDFYEHVPGGSLTANTWTSPSSKQHVFYVDRYGYYSFGKYQSHTAGLPTAYDSDGTFNSKWLETLTNGNILNDLNGKANTNALANLGSGFKAANACLNYSSSGKFGRGKWYLPSVGEFIAAFSRSAFIFNALYKLGLGYNIFDAVTSYEGYCYYWTSTEFSADQAYVFKSFEDDDEYRDTISLLNKATDEVLCGEDDDDVAGPFVRPFAIIEH